MTTLTVICKQCGHVHAETAISHCAKCGERLFAVGSGGALARIGTASNYPLTNVDRVIGTVTSFTQRLETHDYVEHHGFGPNESHLVRAKNEVIWDFRVQMHDQIGDVMLEVPIHLRGETITGMIRDGDHVKIDLPWQVGQTVYASMFLNLTTKSWVGTPLRPDDSMSYGERWGCVAFVLATAILFVDLFAYTGSDFRISIDVNRPLLWNLLSIASILSIGWFAFIGLLLLGALLEWLGVIKR